MEVYQHNQDIIVTVNLPYDNSTSHHIIPTSIVAEIYDSEGTVIASLPITVPQSIQSTINISIPKIYNSLVGDLKRDIRRIKTIFTNANHSLFSENRYIIETDGLLQVMKNSFVTIDGALLLADSLTDIDTWSSFEDRDKISSLITAFEKIIDMPLRYKFNLSEAQNNLTDFVDSGSYYYVNNLRNYTITQFNALPQHLKDALKKAQIYQANYVLEGNGAEERRRDGIISETVGEAKMFFNPRVPMRNPLCRPAMDLMQKYLYKKIRIGRA